MITYGDVAYAVYEVYGGENTLYYRQLNPLNASNGKVTDTGGGSSVNPSLAVSQYLDGSETKNVLHVAWANNGGNTSSKSVYNNNYGTSGDMVSQQMSPDTGIRSDPVIVTAPGAGKLYITYRTDGSPDKLTMAYCDLPACTTFTGPDNLLNPLENWELIGNPDMALDFYNNVSISFLGMNDSTRATTSFQEIFTLAYGAGDATPVYTEQLTDNNVEESDPRLAMEFPIVAIAWRLNPDPGYFQDAYIIDNATSSIRTVFVSPDAVAGGFYDIAINGGDIGGIFIDLASDTQTRHFPWVTFNDISTYLPIIRKQ